MKHKCTAQFNEGRKGLEGKHTNRIMFSENSEKEKQSIESPKRNTNTRPTLTYHCHDKKEKRNCCVNTW